MFFLIVQYFIRSLTFQWTMKTIVVQDFIVRGVGGGGGAHLILALMRG